MSADATDATGEKHIGSDVTPEFKTEVRVAAGRRDMSMSQYIRLALRNQMDRDAE